MSETKYFATKYIRLSYADDKDGESNSVENQRKILDSFISNQPDIEAVSEKVDDGVSGVIFDRKAFKEMMADIEAGEINCVIVKDLSRFGRDYIETGRYLRRILPAYGVRFIALNDNIDTLRDSADDLVVSVKSIINDAYSRDISIKTRSALNIKRINGDYVGACPIYGYRRSDENKNRLEIVDYPASIVRDIFRMKIDGMSALKISETLNARGVLSPMAYKRDRGIPHPTGGFADTPETKWSATAIFRILSDETYMGTLVQGKKGTYNYKIRDVVDRPESEWQRTENAHDHIITAQDFDLAQRIMQLDTRTAPGGNKVYLFSGIIICGCCGGRMTRKTNRYKGKEYLYYYCPTGKKNGCTGAAMVKESDLIECALESVKAHISGIASLESVLAVSDGRKAALALAKQLQEQITDNENQLAKISGFKSSLYENMVSGLLTKEDYKALKTKYTSDEARLRDAVATLEAERDNAMEGRAERLRWMAHFQKFEGLNELDRRTVVNLIRSIRVLSKTELDFTFNYQAEYEEALALLGVPAQAQHSGLCGERKRKPGDSLENQQDIIENHIATSPDIRLVEIDCDNQTTGTNFDRSDFNRMLEDAQSGRINCIIVKDLSRFGRNSIDSGYYIEKQLPAMGVRFIAVTDAFDSKDGDGGVMIPLKNMIAESYALDISRKCRAVQQQNIQDGRFVGRLAPYGYSKAPDDCHRLVIDEEAAAVVRQMFDWAASGMGAGEIVRMLNEMKILPPSHYKQANGLITSKKLIGKPYWQKRVVVDILKSRVYVGDMVQGKTQTKGYKQSNVHPDDWVCVPNTHEPVISREVFDHVQKMLQYASEQDKQVRREAVAYSPHIFKGKVFCAHCGHPMHRHRQNKDGIYWYRCESQWKFHKDACYQVSVKEAELKSEVFALLRKHAEAILGGYIQMERMAPVKTAAADTGLDDINRQLSASGHFLKSLYENMMGGLITADEFAAMKAKYEAKIEVLSKRADEIRTQRREGASHRESFTKFANAASEAIAGNELTADVIDRLVERILVKRDKSFEIVLRFRDEFQEVKRVG